jgi:hypothetical protein
MRSPAARACFLLALGMLVACSAAGREGQTSEPTDAGGEGAAQGGADSGSTDATKADAPAGEGDAQPTDALPAGDDAATSDAAGDTGTPECAPYGAPGQCISTTGCAALGDHTSYAGYCPGPADIECCIVTPSTADNPPVPAGWMLMQQAQVTTDMTTWAVTILDDPTTYPMFSTTTKLFGALEVLARVEWHPPDFNNETIHRGVTLYEPAGSASD